MVVLRGDRIGQASHLLLALALLLAAVDILVASAKDSGVWKPLIDPEDLEPTEVRLEKFVGSLLEERRRSLLTGDAGPLESFYKVSTTGGLFGWENEKRRVSYLRRWAEARGIRILGTEGFVEIDHVAPEEPGGARYWLEITEHMRFTYAYAPESPLVALASTGEAGDGPAPEEGPQEVRFGSRSVQVLEVVRSGESWKIVTNWYCDPLGTYWDPPTVPLSPEKEPPEKKQEAPFLTTASGGSRYDRARAVDYAVRHSGVRSLEEGGRYNLEYRVYSFPGGDCANFASQVLTAGGLPEDGGWRYDRARDEGSTSWVRSESLVWHLLASGTGRCTFRGRFSDLFEDEDGTPRFARIRRLLSEGDIVAYEKGGEIVHVAVVVDFDPLGYPLVASHTADRLFFPFDLGWTDSTVMWFIHIVY